ncbi:hypothetical protein IEN85_18770 [Pelagicoccus sp. NFK12]|uniref:Uncharacterized protein n=1 Tax=Pelagicoccus enzymogenes TaxID=2773457 RepID=A0A927FAU1_9BACT|nr:hypothetical protein [Pelagicoccus enzymogenes]MBD5781552.1 hypothetical protein [Pelagicoccus enzymogenes]
MIDLTTVEPGIGIGSLTFGATQEQLVAILGEPDRITEDIASGEKSISCYYSSKGLSFHFHEENDFRLETIESSDPNVTLFGKTYIGRKRSELLKEIKKDERFDQISEEEDRIEIESLSLNFWIEEDLVSDMQWGVLMSDEAEISWPTKTNQPAEQVGGHNSGGCAPPPRDTSALERLKMVSPKHILTVILAVVAHTQMSAETTTTVTLNSNALRVGDTYSEGIVLKLEIFEIGDYEVPYSAIEKGGRIAVDSAIIYFIDDSKAKDFKQWKEEKDEEYGYNEILVIQNLSEFGTKHEIKVGYIISEGVGTQFPGDGSYSINLKKLRKL